MEQSSILIFFRNVDVQETKSKAQSFSISAVDKDEIRKQNSLQAR